MQGAENYLKSWEPARPLQRSPGPFGPKMPKKSRKCLQVPPAPGPQREVSGMWSVFWSVPGLFGNSLGSRGRRPGRRFRDSFGISGLTDQETSVRGGLAANLRADFGEGDEDSNFSIFRVRRFSEGPEPLH